MTLLLPLSLMLMQVGIDPRGGQVPGVPEELRNRPPRGAAVSATPSRPAIEICLATARDDPSKARTLAGEWVARTTGAQRAAGNHCLGVAAANAGDWAAASGAFLAARSDASGASFRGRMAVLAGNALLAQDKPVEALATLDAAREEAAAEATLAGAMAVERARALVALEREPEAGATLAKARQLTPSDPTAWLLSATLTRRQGDLASAQQQIERAAALDPRNPAVGLEAGVIAALGGNDAAARRSFESVITTAPESEQAASAKAYLAQLKP